MLRTMEMHLMVMVDQQRRKSDKFYVFLLIFVSHSPYYDVFLSTISPKKSIKSYILSKVCILSII